MSGKDKAALVLYVGEWEGTYYTQHGPKPTTKLLKTGTTATHDDGHRPYKQATGSQPATQNKTTDTRAYNKASYKLQTTEPQLTTTTKAPRTQQQTDTGAQYPTHRHPTSRHTSMTTLSLSCTCLDLKH